MEADSEKTQTSFITTKTHIAHEKESSFSF
ncbi:hypothetical protein HDE69_005302 [Pedobacter cryoconitis]|uniref:Uncharacterized protein n=1 Tax=Pedobacter cryoconitis TaxID=188932 RepID=A0A7W9DNF7_9SPHI|nr:hypothetical protein [Pedobacter cryoconitis]